MHDEGEIAGYTTLCLIVSDHPLYTCQLETIKDCCSLFFVELLHIKFNDKTFAAYRMFSCLQAVQASFAEGTQEGFE